MSGFALALLFLQVQQHTLVGEEVREHGRYVEVARLADTLTVWVQDVGLARPRYDRAASADRVLWCYPQRHPHPRHVFPRAEGKVAYLRSGDKAVFVTRDGAERIGAGEVFSRK